MTTTEITAQQRLTLVKHLAGGKTLPQVALIMRLPEPTVLDIASHHGYPKTEALTKAADILERNLNDDRRSGIPNGTAAPLAVTRPARPSTTSPSSVTNPDARPVGQPDEIRVLINTAKSHPSKRIQAAGERVLDAVGRLRDLITEDQAKHAERRRADAAKAEQRAEVQRLERQLAAAKAKLRGTPTMTAEQGGGPRLSAQHRTQGQLPLPWLRQALRHRPGHGAAPAPALHGV